jgi:hypothetical protein
MKNKLTWKDISSKLSRTLKIASFLIAALTEPGYTGSTKGMGMGIPARNEISISNIHESAEKPTVVTRPTWDDKRDQIVKQYSLKL